MIDSIYIARQSGELPMPVDEIELVADKGIVGERNFEKDQWPGQNVTFIEAEEIERFNATYGRDLEPGAFRRNIITRGVRLNELVGETFSIGGLEFYAVELCEPCATLGGYLATASLPAAEVVKALVHRGGLRANVLSSGLLRVGMEFSTEAGNH